MLNEIFLSEYYTESSERNGLLQHVVRTNKHVALIGKEWQTELIKTHINNNYPFKNCYEGEYFKH